MAMRGLLVAVACAVAMGGCYDSSSIVGYGDASTVATTGECGNGVEEPGEQCDDGNDDDCDGCTSDCEWARALHVDGGVLGASVVEESIPCLPCPFTIEVWFRVDDEHGLWDLFDIPSYAHSSFGAHAHDYSTFMGGGTDGGWWDGIAPGTWHHWAASCFLNMEGATQSTFIDGEWNGAVGSAEHLPSCSGPMSIADALSSLSGGSIDDLRFTGRALYMWSDFLPSRHLSASTDTVALWNFNQEIDGVIPDVSGNGHDAVLVDGTLVPDDCHLP
jgi:cysteine-rich repeat protein